LILLNDWSIGRYLGTIIVLQLAMLAVVSMDALDIELPVISQIIGFVYLNFVPGIILLRIFRLHNLGILKTLLYSLGLSIAFLMILGLFVNIVYYSVGMAHPLSTWPLIITIILVLSLLAFLSYIRDRSFAAPTKQAVEGVFPPPTLLLVLLPFLSVIGTSLVNFYENNFLLMVMIGMITLVVILIAFGRFIPRNQYPLAVFMIAISLLLHRSLITMHLAGWDIQSEYYFFSLTDTNSYWDSTSPVHAFNAMLSITVLPTIYSSVMNIEGVWLFKIMYPLLYSFVPLVLFQIFRDQVEDRIAFLSVFLIMATQMFFFEMPEIVRFALAQLFFALLIQVLLDKKLSALNRNVLLIMFGFSLAVSHYSLTYMCLIYLFLTWILLMVFRAVLPLRRTRDQDSGLKPVYPLIESLVSGKTLLTGSLVAVFFVIAFAWYMYVASGETFYNVYITGHHIYHSLSAGLFSSDTSDLGVLRGLGLASLQVESLERDVYGVFSHAIRLLIALGVIGMVIKYRETRLNPIFATLALVNAVMLATVVLVPFLGLGTGSMRWYFLSLFVLAPFLVFGWQTVLNLIARLFRIGSGISRDLSLKLVLIILLPYFLFNVGFIYELTGDVPNSISLSSSLEFARYDQQEVSAAKWLTGNVDESDRIQAETYAVPVLYGYREPFSVFVFEEEEDTGHIAELPNDTYIYLRGRNVEDEKIFLHYKIRLGDRKLVDLQEAGLPEEMTEIYDNGGAECYHYN